MIPFFFDIDTASVGVSRGGKSSKGVRNEKRHVP